MALSERLMLIAPHAGVLLIAAALSGACHRSGGDSVRIGVAGSFSDPIGLPMKQAAELQKLNGRKFVHDWRVESLQSCSACHR